MDTIDSIIKKLKNESFEKSGTSDYLLESIIENIKLRNSALEAMQNEADKIGTTGDKGIYGFIKGRLDLRPHPGIEILRTTENNIRSSFRILKDQPKTEGKEKEKPKGKLAEMRASKIG